MKLAIIVVTYNSQRDIERLLNSLVKQSVQNFTVYVIDNNSSDDTLSKVRTFLAKLSIIIISCKQNNGYARGNNIGIQKAMEDGCEFVFILNPDMQLEENCIKSLYKKFLADENIGVIGPIVLIGNHLGQAESIQGYGVKANFRTQKKKVYYGGQEYSNQLPDEVEVDYVHGGAMMIRADVLKTTGLFDENYFMYNDELDISFRIKKSGFRILCIRDAVARHYHDFDKKNIRGNNLMYYYVMRNRYLYFKKFGFYVNLFISVFKEILMIPFIIRWAIMKMENKKLLKFYYLGIFDGLLGKKGISNRNFG